MELIGHMKGTAVIALAVLGACAQAQTIFYGGDFNGINGHASQVGGTTFEDVRSYDDFTLTEATDITGVFGNFLHVGSIGSSSLYWEIRQGVAEGFGGSVVHAATVSPATVTDLGNTFLSYNQFLFESSVTPFTLGPGTYYLTVAVQGGADAAYLCDTDGANGVGSPLDNNHAFVDAWDPFASSHYINWQEEERDFSMGLNGAAAVPEPASMVALGLGAAALLKRRRQAKR